MEIALSIFDKRNPEKKQFLMRSQMMRFIFILLLLGPIVAQEEAEDERKMGGSSCFGESRSHS